MSPFDFINLITGITLTFDRTCKEQPAAYPRAVLSLVPKDFAMTVERDETTQHIEVRFVDQLPG
jgi:hypothetical protein